ncbi:MAG: hypothetical protein MJ113_04410 [Lachnospiraceae bacterium]|nr:hypothetical protein [Lachnospiraceae bacterium]
MLKQIWPYPYKIKKGSLSSFIWELVVSVVVIALVGFLFSILSGVAIIGPIFVVLGSLIEAYSIVNVVLCVLVFLGITK